MILGLEDGSPSGAAALAPLQSAARKMKIIAISVFHQWFLFEVSLTSVLVAACGVADR
jgi:hypothetical protein